MKETKEIKAKKEEKELLIFTSKTDADEFEMMALGRKFCKRGERLQDICEQEIERYDYENSINIFTKIFRRGKFKKSKQKFLLENRITSNIRAIVSKIVNEYEGTEEISLSYVMENVKKYILKRVEEYK